MLKKILSYGSVEALSKGLNRGVTFLLPLIISSQHFGKVGLIVAAEVLVPILTLLGLDRALIHFYHEKENYNRLSSTVFVSITGLQAVISGIACVLWLSGTKELFGITLFPHLFILLTNIYLSNINQIFLNIQRVKEDHVTYFSNRILFQAVKFILVIGLSFYFRDELGYLIGVLVALCVISLYHFRKYREEFSFTASNKTLRYLLLFCWPFIFHAIAGSLLGNIDRFILERYISLSALGVYTLAYAIGSSVAFAFQGISVYLEPLIYKAKDQTERESKLRYYLHISLFGGATLVVILLLAAEFFLPRFFQPEYHEALRYIPVIAIANLFLPYYFQANYRLVADKRPLSIAQISVAIAAVNIGLNYFFIPLYGVSAAALCSFVCFFLLAFILLLRSNNWKWKFVNTEQLVMLLIGGIALFLDKTWGYVLYGLGLCVYHGISLRQHATGSVPAEIAPTHT